MFFPNRMKNPKALMSIGKFCLAASLSFTRFVHPTAHFGPDLLDGTRGLLTGLSIGMSLWSVMLFCSSAPQRRKLKTAVN